MYQGVLPAWGTPTFPMSRFIALAAAFFAWGLAGWFTGEYPGVAFFVGVAVGAGAMLTKELN